MKCQHGRRRPFLKCVKYTFRRGTFLFFLLLLCKPKQIFLPTKNYKKQIVIPVHSGSFFLYVFTVGRVFFVFFPLPLRPQTLQMSLLRQTVLVRFNLTKRPSSLWSFSGLVGLVEAFEWPSRPTLTHNRKIFGRSRNFCIQQFHLSLLYKITCPVLLSGKKKKEQGPARG